MQLLLSVSSIMEKCSDTLPSHIQRRQLGRQKAHRDKSASTPIRRSIFVSQWFVVLLAFIAIVSHQQPCHFIKRTAKKIFIHSKPLDLSYTTCANEAGCICEVIFEYSTIFRCLENCPTIRVANL